MNDTTYSIGDAVRAEVRTNASYPQANPLKVPIAGRICDILDDGTYVLEISEEGARINVGPGNQGEIVEKIDDQQAIEFNDQYGIVKVQDLDGHIYFVPEIDLVAIQAVANIDGTGFPITDISQGEHGHTYLAVRRHDENQRFIIFKDKAEAQAAKDIPPRLEEASISITNPQYIHAMGFTPTYALLIAKEWEDGDFE